VRQHRLYTTKTLVASARVAYLSRCAAEYGVKNDTPVYRRFGAQVTVIEMQDRLIAREDEDVSDAVRDILAGEGVAVRLKARCQGFEQCPSGVRMEIDCELDATPVDGSHLLLAVGRRPNTDDLGLDNAGIDVDDRGFIRVDEALRTSVEGVWAVGEVNGRGAFTHTSYNDYEIVDANLFDNEPRRTSDRILCYGLFIDPPLGRVGMTAREAQASGQDVLVGKRMMTRVGRAGGRRDARLHEDTRRRRQQEDPRCRFTWTQRRRGRSCAPGHHVRSAALHGGVARRAYPPDGV
jgi:pyruvate/2-oxoglutarate dehydrogenase complex dihydrolipoamide dehydrogenase (E3) component